MTEGLTELTLNLQGSPPYGFRIAGGDGDPITVARVRTGSKAEQGGLKEGDVVLVVNGVICRNLSYDAVFALTEYDEDQVTLVVLRGRDNAQFWREASDGMRGRMRLLNEEQVKEMIKHRPKYVEKFDRPFGNHVFQLETPTKSWQVSSSPVNVRVDGNDIKIEAKPHEIVHVPLKLEGSQRVFVREVLPTEVERKEERYSFYSSNEQPSGKDAAYPNDTIPTIIHTFVSQNKLRLGDSIAEKMDSALNPSIFFDSPQQTSLSHSSENFQREFKVTQNHAAKSPKEPAYQHNSENKPLGNGERIIPVMQEAPNKFQSVAKLNMNPSKPSEGTNAEKVFSQKTTEGFLIKQNDKPIRKIQDEILDFTPSKIFSDYLPQTSLNYQPMFKPKEPPKPPQPASDYPFLDFSRDFQEPHKVEEQTSVDFKTPSYSEPTQNHAVDRSFLEASNYKPSTPSHPTPTQHTIPKAPPTPQMENKGDGRQGGTQKEMLNSKAAIAKDVALSVTSEANQNSKGQKMFLKRRQNSENWTIQGPDPPKPAPVPVPVHPQEQYLSKSTLNSSTNDSADVIQENSKGPPAFESQPQHYYNPSFPTHPQFNHLPPSNFPHQPPMDPHYHPYNPHNPWSHPSYSYPPSYPQHHGPTPTHNLPYQNPQPHHFYTPYQPSQPYHPPHPHTQPYHTPHPHIQPYSPYYPPFPQTQPQIHPYPTNPQHQPTTPLHQFSSPYLPQVPPHQSHHPSHPPQPPSHLIHPQNQPSIHAHPTQPQDIVDYCDL